MHKFRSAFQATLLAVSAATISFGAQAAESKPFCDVETIIDLQYGTGATQNGDMPLYLDAYIPVRCNGKPMKDAPPVGIVHGGGFIGGDKGGTRAEMGLYLAERGFAAFSINYRLQGDKPTSEHFTAKEMEALLKKYVPKSDVKETPEETARVFYLGSIATEDAIKAKKWVNANKNRFRINTEKWGVVGGSAGAATVLNMGYGADDIFKEPQKMSGVVAMWGDMPAPLMEAGEPPLLIIHGTEDQTVPYERSTILLERAKKVGIPVTRLTGEGLGHSLAPQGIFKAKVPGTDTSMMDAIVVFFDKTLR